MHLAHFVTYIHTYIRTDEQYYGITALEAVYNTAGYALLMGGKANGREVWHSVNVYIPSTVYCSVIPFNADSLSRVSVFLFVNGFENIVHLITFAIKLLTSL